MVSHNKMLVPESRISLRGFRSAVRKRKLAERGEAPGTPDAAAGGDALPSSSSPSKHKDAGEEAATGPAVNAGAREPTEEEKKRLAEIEAEKNAIKEKLEILEEKKHSLVIKLKHVRVRFARIQDPAGRIAGQFPGPAGSQWSIASHCACGGEGAA